MPRHSRRAGFTLVELLVALIIFVLVAGSLYNVINVSQRTARTQTEKAAMQGSLRTGLQLVTAELQELWTDEAAGGSAITAMSTTSLSYNAMRGLGTTCANTAATTLTVNAETWLGLIEPAAGQGIYVFDQGDDEASESDDVWHDETITAVADGVCADGLTKAYILTITNLASTVYIEEPGPVRNYQAMQLGRIASGGQNWLGVGVDGGALTPLAGPLTSTGLLIEYMDEENNDAIGNAPTVRSIILHLYGQTDRPVNATFGGTTTIVEDSLVVRVQLRNGR